MFERKKSLLKNFSFNSCIVYTNNNINNDSSHLNFCSKACNGSIFHDSKATYIDAVKTVVVVAVVWYGMLNEFESIFAGSKRQRELTKLVEQLVCHTKMQASR